MRVVVTGAEGFVGIHLRRALAERGHQVLPVVQRSPAPGERALDLPDDRAARELVADLEPDALVHLAGLSSVPDCERDPEGTRRVNVGGTASLARAIAQTGLPCRMLFVSSAVVYGQTPPELQPVTETTPTQPANCYGASKLEAERVVEEMARQMARPPVILRPFNHIGPGQPPHFALPSFARQIAEIERGMVEPVLRVGNLDVRRDFLDVRDVVAAYASVVETASVAGTFVVASGEAYRLRDLVEQFRSYARTSFDVVTSPDRLRTSDLEVLVGDASRFRRETGWRPKVAMEKTLLDLLGYWRTEQSLP